MKWIGANANNFGVGRNGKTINKIVVHWMVGTLESCDATFQSPTRKASAHYGIGDNDIHQYVKEEDTAWHASNLTVNRESIGIEHEGGPDLPITDATYQTSANLIREICQRYNLPIDRDHIKGHREFAATQCPGTLDIDRLIQLAKGEDMTEEQKRILQFLDEQGANEGKVREAFGALAEQPVKALQLATLSEKVSDLESVTQELDEKIRLLGLEIAKKEKSIKDWQREAETAKEQASNAIAQIQSANEEKNKYRRLYEAQLDNSVEKMTVRQLINLIIRKVTKK